MDRLLVTALVTLTVVAISPANADILITVNKTVQRMTVTVDGEPRWNWPVSSGRAGYDTPSGAYTAFRMEADHLSKEWDYAPMPHAIFFTNKGHAIHGSYDWRHLGSAASHGCVRLSPANAATLFALVKMQGLGNTKVVVVGRQPARASATARRTPVPELPDASNRPLSLQPSFEQINSQPRFAQPQSDFSRFPVGGRFFGGH